MYFRVEDENGISPNLRKYGWDDSYNTKVDASCADKLIAQEIRDEVNNTNNRSVFSCSKSLGIILFKYNYIADNPIHLIPVRNTSGFVEFDIFDENGTSNYCCIPYNISNLEYPIRKCFQGREIILKNYIIEVDDNILLNKYLTNYTGVGKKKIAACEKDREVIIRHIVNDYTIEEYIDAVYLIYALQYKTGFLNCVGVVKKLIEMFYEEIENQNEYEGFVNLVLYLEDNWYYEKQISKKILKEKRQAGRVVIPYDAYFLALDIMDGEIKEALINSSYCLPYRLLGNIWDIFSNRYTFPG